MTFEEYSAKWIKVVQGAVSKSTYDTYRGYLKNYIYPYLGNKDFSELSVEVFNIYTDELLKRVNTDIVRKVYSALIIICDKAVEENLIPYNYAKNANRPTRTGTNKKMAALSLTISDMKKIVSQAKEDEIYTTLMCILSLGVKRGELLALRWSDINFNEKLVSIQNELVVRQKSEKTIVCLVKSKNPREISIPIALLEILKKEHSMSKAEILFPSPNDPTNFRHPQAVRKQIDKSVKKALGRGITIEELGDAFNVVKDEQGLDESQLIIKITEQDESIEVVKSKVRKPGTGCITMLNDHLWEGRYSPKVNGKRMARNVYAHTEEECEEKLAELIREMKIEIEKLKQGG
jgi:integrase